MSTTQSQRFGYDAQSRLSSWKVGSGILPTDPSTLAQTWTLSPVGDWTRLATATTSGTTTTTTNQNRTHTAVHELISVDVNPLAYDAKGNLTRDDQGQTFSWDPENRLLAAGNLKQGQGTSAAYAYDALGRRVRASITYPAAGATPVTTVATTFVNAGAQEVLAITGDLTAFGDPTADPEAAGAAPYNASTGQGARGSLLAQSTATRVNFQPVSTDTPDGWSADVGTARATSTARGWSVARTGTDRDHLGRPLYDSFIPLGTATWQIPVANGTHAVVIMCGDADSRAQTNHLTVNGVAVVDPTPYDGRVTNGYETGSFDGYALTVTVSNGLLTITAGAGALTPKIDFIEIGAAGTTIDATTAARVTAAAVQATKDTAKPKAKTPPTVKRNVWGVYVDELVSYTVAKPRKSPVRYYTHANSLYSIAATTNAAGAVVERYSYNAYGVRTVKNSAGATLAKSAVGNVRGFTSYKLDSETGLYFARARMYSPKLGRFIGRDFLGYLDGESLYRAYFVPLKVDPYGLSETCPACIGICGVKIGLGNGGIALSPTRVTCPQTCNCIIQFAKNTNPNGKPSLRPKPPHGVFPYNDGGQGVYPGANMPDIQTEAWAICTSANDPSAGNAVFFPSPPAVGPPLPPVVLPPQNPPKPKPPVHTGPEIDA